MTPEAIHSLYSLPQLKVAETNEIKTKTTKDKKGTKLSMIPDLSSSYVDYPKDTFMTYLPLSLKLKHCSLMSKSFLLIFPKPLWKKYKSLNSRKLEKWKSFKQGVELVTIAKKKTSTLY